LNENPPPAVKEASELLLNKLTGFQLLSQEAGPIQQLVVQIPFVLGGKTTELTMQWSGKKTSDGKIDADFCRVLFYLKLEHLNDLIVDMQVQNRVMSVQIFNENAGLKRMSEQMTPMLKSKLAEFNYHLSSVHFHVSGQSQPGKNQRSLSDFYSQKEYSGVDIKI
jgi:RecG-like helicase